MQYRGKCRGSWRTGTDVAGPLFSTRRCFSAESSEPFVFGPSRGYVKCIGKSIGVCRFPARDCEPPGEKAALNSTSLTKSVFPPPLALVLQLDDSRTLGDFSRVVQGVHPLCSRYARSRATRVEHSCSVQKRRIRFCATEN